MSTTSDSARRSTAVGRKRYDEQFKVDAVRLRQQSGRSRAQVARDLGISDVSLAAWEARYGTEGAGAVTRSAATQTGAAPLGAVAALAEVARLQRELEWMTRQRDILKKAMAIVSQEPLSTTK
ncbi:MAG TPA: transposase [Verrucomicrobiales bacterium]|nr:transposase [Verrucomicrobiales bacterium]